MKMILIAFFSFSESAGEINNHIWYKMKGKDIILPVKKQTFKTDINGTTGFVKTG